MEWIVKDGNACFGHLTLNTFLEGNLEHASSACDICSQPMV